MLVRLPAGAGGVSRAGPPAGKPGRPMAGQLGRWRVGEAACGGWRRLPAGWFGLWSAGTLVSSRGRPRAGFDGHRRADGALASCSGHWWAKAAAGTLGGMAAGRRSCWMARSAAGGQGRLHVGWRGHWGVGAAASSRAAARSLGRHPPGGCGRWRAGSVASWLERLPGSRGWQRAADHGHSPARAAEQGRQLVVEATCGGNRRRGRRLLGRRGAAGDARGGGDHCLVPGTVRAVAAAVHSGPEAPSGGVAS